MEEPKNKYILLHDRVGYNLERNLLALGLSTKSTPTEVLRGELLEAFPEAEQPSDLTRIALVVINRKSLHLECRTEDLTQLSDEDANLLLAIFSTQLRYDTYIERKRLDFGRRLLPGSEVFVSVKGVSQDVPGVVWYKGEFPATPGTMFGVQLIKNPGQGTTDGTFRGKRYFTCPPDSGVFVGLDKLKPREDPDSYSLPSSPKRDKNAQANFIRVMPPYTQERVKNAQANFNFMPPRMPPFSKGKNKQKSSQDRADKKLEIDQRVVTFVEDNPVRGTVRYIGEEKDTSGNLRTIVGLEMDEGVGSGSGKRNGRQLFVCRKNFARFVTLETVILEKDFDENPTEATGKNSPDKQDPIQEQIQNQEYYARSLSYRTSVDRGKDPKEDLQGQLRDMEQQVTNVQEQLRVKELQEVNLHEQLREKEQQEENSKRQLREIEQQLRERDEHEETLQRQLRELEQRLENSERLSTEKEQQLTHFQRQLREKELQEASLHGQLRVKSQEEENLQRQLNETEQQLREREEREETLQRQLRELEQQLTNLQEQLREKEDESGNLQQQVTTLEGQLRAKDQEMNELETTLSTAQQALSENQRQQTPDWVISRDQIQLTDKLLGRGGWGSVVEGKYCGCAVAVKQIHELILSAHNRSLFEREMDIASRCRHPCLLQFIGATNDEGSPLFLTELMESSLRALLEQRPLTATEVSIISLDVARALSYLHQKKPSPIIHRDISSANVLLWRQGDQWRGKVSDYGTANFIQHTMTVAPGAMIYIAPEALTSTQTVKVDVYSFGVLLCEMCIQQLPDPERRDQQIAMVTNRLLRALVRRCVQTEPGARPNMEEIIEELEEPV